MGSTQQPDRSLASGIPIPQWMKTKMNDRFDLEDTAFSPPNQDDSFFYMRYPRHHVETEKLNCNTERIVDSGEKPKVIHCNTDTRQSTNMTDVVINKENTHLTKTAKSLAGDDIFHGDHPGYGHSIVQVAHQMISGGLVGRPTLLGHKQPDDQKREHTSPTQRTRRGSKSLPASPLSTPDSTPQIHRKNRYFTNPFVETDSDRYSKYPGSWLLAGVLSTQREAAGSRDTLDGSQLDLADPDHGKQIDNDSNRTDSLRRNKSSTCMRTEHQENADIGLPPNSSERPKKNQPPVQYPRPKPSELRELNFWSPTSM